MSDSKYKTVQRFYKVCIFYECCPGDIDFLTDKLLKLGKDLDDCNVFEGNAAFSPYVEAEAIDSQKLELFINKASKLVLSKAIKNRFDKYLRKINNG